MSKGLSDSINFIIFLIMLVKREKLIFRKFLNIEKVVNLTNLDSGGFTLSKIEELGILFEVILRPLMSRNARTMYAVFVEEKVEHLTTLDIQHRLRELNVKLSKKEINAWLKSLQEAGLIDRGKDRGKPTTLDYDDKYTFDMWSLTMFGSEMSSSIVSLLNRGEASLEPTLPDLEEIPFDLAIRIRFFEELEGLYLKLALLRRLLREDQGLAIERNKGNSLLLDIDVDKAINELVDKNLIQKERNPPSHGLFSRLKTILGISKKGSVIKLTEKGREIALSFQ
jgi:predicted transcriptional regulator